MNILRAIAADLRAKADSQDQGWSAHDKDVFTAIADCIDNSKPIDKELQDQYVKAIANQQAVNRFGQ